MNAPGGWDVVVGSALMAAAFHLGRRPPQEGSDGARTGLSLVMQGFPSREWCHVGIDPDPFAPTPWGRAGRISLPTRSESFLSLSQGRAGRKPSDGDPTVPSSPSWGRAGRRSSSLLRVSFAFLNRVPGGSHGARGPILMISTVAPEPPGRPDRTRRGVSLSLVGIHCLGGGARAHPPGVAPGSERES